jgi:hypothetical protein
MSRSGIRVGSNPTQRGSIPRRCASSTQETPVSLLERARFRLVNRSKGTYPKQSLARIFLGEQ